MSTPARRNRAKPASALRRARGADADTSDAPIHSLDEIAAALGVTRQAVQQIERRALAKLRTALEARGFTARSLLGD